MFMSDASRAVASLISHTGPMYMQSCRCIRPDAQNTANAAWDSSYGTP